MLSFIIPCFNELHHTRRCVESIIANSPPNTFNFIFINNGSTDGTGEYLKTVPNSFTITNERNIYVNPAWNQGFKYLLEKNAGDYVCLCNNDIIAGRNWLDVIYNLFETREGECYVPVSNSKSIEEGNLQFPYNNENEFNNYVNRLSLIPFQTELLRVDFMGFCIFMKTKHVQYFYPIPDVIKVLRGDNWIIDSLVTKCVFPVKVSHCAIYHVGSVTQRALSIDDIRNNDIREFDKLLHTEYKKRRMTRLRDEHWNIRLL